MLRARLAFARVLLAFAAPFALAGCSIIAGSGPTTGDIAEQAGPPGAPSFELIDVSPVVIETLRQRGPESFRAHFGDYRPSVEPRIGIGDTVSVTIWEASTGGLFSASSPEGTVSTGSKSATIPEQVVGRDGTIMVPYAGRIRVAGRTAREVQSLVEGALQGKAIQPQALINVMRSMSNMVTVTGEVANGARVPLSVKGDRVLDVIAAAGGIRAPVNETYVQLSRGPVTVRVAMTKVTSDPRENIYVRPDDVLTLIRDPQTFIAAGASGRNAEIPFDAEGINLSQAIAKASGLLDGRADPGGVFVFRFEPEQVVRALRPDSPLIQPGWLTPVVYRFDMHSATAMFVAQRFPMQSRDLLYISDAPIANFRKMMEIVGLVTQPVMTGLTAIAVVSRLNN